MKIAILSDIHSNKYALKAVLKKADGLNISQIIVLGDFFGYYPWAVETYQMISKRKIIAIKGNHDLLVCRNDRPRPTPPYWKAAKENRRLLHLKCPEALKWLKGLKCKRKITIGRIKFSLFHGTPDYPLNGRLYPDNTHGFRWFPAEGEILLLGHTHYPLEMRIPHGGIIINPGSVGQPRDGNPYPCWCILDIEDLSVSWQRTKYNYRKAVGDLERLSWEKRSIVALQKTYKGAFHL